MVFDMLVIRKISEEEGEGGKEESKNDSRNDLIGIYY